MQHASIVRCVVGLCTCLRLSQRKTLGELVFGAMQCRRVSIANIGRSLESGALPKHCIKRVYRFLSNARVEAADCVGKIPVLTLCPRAPPGVGLAGHRVRLFAPPHRLVVPRLPVAAALRSGLTAVTRADCPY